MSGWRARLGMGLLMLAALAAHAHATADLPNTPLALLVFHGTAALCDGVLLLAAPALLHGHLCDDTETLLLASIIGNALGWLLYMAYLPPVFYNASMGALALMQGLRLLYVDNDDADYLGLHLVRGTDFVGAQPYFTKAHQ
jgi:uncharacterized phosphosugar-binding protein